LFGVSRQLVQKFRRKCVRMGLFGACGACRGFDSRGSIIDDASKDAAMNFQTNSALVYSKLESDTKEERFQWS